MLQSDVQSAVNILRKGGILVYPTDTVWGIGCDATCSEAVKRIYRIKQRADSKALITLVGSLGMLERWVNPIPEVAFELIEAAVRPMTIVYDSPMGLAPELLADDGSAAIRVTTDPFCRAILKALRHPLVSTSANISGCPTPRCFADIDKSILQAADYVAIERQDQGPADSKPSTVIKLCNDSSFKIIRN